MKTSAYVIEIEQLEKETGKTMHNTRHELAKLITQNERLQQENQQLKKQKDDVVEYIKCLIKRLEEFDIPKRKETGAFWYQVMGELEELLRMLGEIDELD